ncbi:MULTISPECIES: hypothetical protein [Nitrospirillum]|uniref:Uncharacterized protein n=2 Tax=Nitrospirillum TaxID=1543705 RepID=A0A560HWZ4_9PROT|nr:hypothetical protein [Nitrospirillum amazonense]MEC4589996.1 hypothetical protein [Nitrospirillum amazonense]TWB19173.1 hypothetical protein FBZ88_12227 [Nitrospirillum amazonense]TWB49564.1 hypothetical protein FBZ92_126104 [Nitrospirillum amazonense]
MNSASSPRRRSYGGLLAAAVLLLPLGALVMPTSVLTVIGMVPTLVAWIVDRDPDKPAAVTVGGLNLCGVMPFCIQLWQHGHTMDYAAGLLVQPVTWLVMYSAAGVGWLLYFGIPPLVAGWAVARDQAKIRELDEQRQALVEEWGIEVTGQGLKAEAPAEGEAASEEPPDPLAESTQPGEPATP